MNGHMEKTVATVLKKLFKQDICYRFYVEKKAKSKIAEELGCSRNTVKKYIKECPESLYFAAAKNENLMPEVHHAFPLKTLQLSLKVAIEAGDLNLYQVEVLEMANDQIKYLGITSPIDLLKIEIAFENYLQYRMFSRRVIDLNSQIYDASWLKSSEKMVKIVSRYSDAAQKHLRNFQDLIKELEIKYNKRSPDFGRIQNLNIQRNEISLNQESIERVIHANV